MSPGIAFAVLASVMTIGATLTACYDVPRPACGFVCGPDGACPDGYRCAADRSCHRDGAPADLVCVTPDALLPIDAAVDTRQDASRDAAAADASVDALPDAAGVDAPAVR